jgi:serine/threonine-protein kinase HipA
MALISVTGRNMIGRVQVAPSGADLDEPPKPVDVAALLQGGNSEEAFNELVRQHVTSGVSGVVPKFLDGDALSRGLHKKATLFTHQPSSKARRSYCRLSP